MAKARTKTFHPQVLTANRLRDGDVVYWAKGEVWGEELSGAMVFKDSDAVAAAEAHGRLGVEQRLIIDAYFFPVTQNGDEIQPTQTREVIRAKGPTVRLDLGKQAQAGATS